MKSILTQSNLNLVEITLFSVWETQGETVLGEDQISPQHL